MTLQLHKLHLPINIKLLLFRDQLYKSIIGIDNIKSYKPDLNLTDWYLVEKDKEPIGLWIIRDFSWNCISYHGGMYKQYRSKETPKIVNELINITKKLYPGKVLITTVPESNRLALKLNKKLGMHTICTIKNGAKNSNLIILSE